MVTINKINLKQDDMVQKKFLGNIKTVLQKIGSSHKTKAIHKLITSEMLYIGYGSVDISKKRNAEYGTMYLSGNKLSGLIADLGNIVDPSELTTMSKKVKDIEKSNKELQRVKSTITDTSAMQLKNLDENISKMFDELLDSIDYFSLVDVYYYLYINTLAIIGLKGNGKNKIFEASYNVFKAAVSKILKKLHVKPDRESIERIEIILDYIFARNFTDQSSSTTLAKLTRMYSAEKIEFLKEMKPDQYSDFKHIAVLFTKAGIINITENSFMNEFKN
ncbi:MAG: hypothetical protein DRG78_07435, partial [Epsilonproteobacteria bacterium]